MTGFANNPGILDALVNTKVTSVGRHAGIVAVAVR